MTLKTVGRRLAVVLLLCLSMAGDAAAVQVTLNLIQSQSHLTLTGNYIGNQFRAQDDPAFFTTYDPGNTITDFDPAHLSNRTTLAGTITVEVDNPLAPTTIQILSANMDATATGEWLPEPFFDGDYNENGADGVDVNAADYVVGRKFPNTFGGDPAWYNSWRQQYGEQDGGDPTDGVDAGPALPADIGIKIVADFGVPGCCDAAYAALRDVNYNLTTQTIGIGGGTPVVEPVNAQGEFSSQSQFIRYRTGWFDYWIEPFSGDDQLRDSVVGDCAPNHYEVDQSTSPDTYTPLPNAPKSTYVVSGGVATLTIPVDMNILDQLTQLVDGQLVATIVLSGSGGSGTVPEPTSTVFLVMAGCAYLLLGRARQRR